MFTKVLTIKDPKLREVSKDVKVKNKKDKQQIDLASRGLKIASLVDKENKKLILVKKENKEETERI